MLRQKKHQVLTASPRSLLTTLFSSISHLLPRIIFSTSSLACWKCHIQSNTLHVVSNWQHMLLHIMLFLFLLILVTRFGPVVVIPYLIYISQPLDNVIKCLFICYIIHEHDAHRASVVRRGDGVETLLPCCVPDLQLDFLASQLNCFDFEVYACRRSPHH